jgi:glycosyltransferase involved in cell wall biosynthesis
VELHTFRRGSGDYLAFLGRVSPEKGLERAIEIARRTGQKLKIAAKIYEEDRPYYDHTIEPLLRSSSSFVEFLGEIGGSAKDEFLGDAKALLFPVEWSEPFGLVMIEALATGTPVIAWRRGSVPEVVQHGVTGFIVSNMDEGVAAVAQLNRLDRNECRKDFEARFTSGRMAKDYLRLYEDAIAARSVSSLPPPAGRE